MIIPTRVRKPRDKAKVENAVQQVERWVLAPLRNQRFFSAQEANAAVAERLVWLNNRAFQKKEGTRRTHFEQIDRPALKPLPREPLRDEFNTRNATRHFVSCLDISAESARLSRFRPSRRSRKSIYASTHQCVLGRVESGPAGLCRASFLRGLQQEHQPMLADRARSSIGRL